MGTAPRKPRHLPLWQLALLGVVRAVQGVIVFPLQRMWRSPDPIDAYGLNHLTSVAGDALLAISLADSIFFHVPVAESRLRVALFLGLTVLPLALAGPLIVPILDRAGPRRSVTFAAAAGRCLLALFLAPQLDSNLLFPIVLLMLVLSKIHGLVKNGLTMAYASRQEGLMRANARLGRIAVAGAIGAAPVGFLTLKAFGGAGPIYTAALVYGTSALCTLRLPHPGRLAEPHSQRKVATRGRIPQLALPAMGAIGIRAAGGFLLFLMAFALRDAEVAPWVFAVVAGAGITGTFLADIVAPTLRTHTREEAVVIASVCSAGIGALVAAELFRVPLLAIYALTAGAASEFARLAFASLMQRYAPEGALGRVFVRYEVLFQGAWVAGAFVPVLLPISFRQGMVVLTLFYGALAGTYVWRVRTRRRVLRPGADGADRPDPEGRTAFGRARVGFEDHEQEGTMAEFITVAATGDVEEGAAKAFEVKGAEVAVARSGSALYAFSDICTHRHCNLSMGGEIEGTTIQCECHGSMFSMETGEVIEGPATEPIQTYGVREQDGQIQIEA